MKLPETGNIAHAIVELLAQDCQRREEVVELARALLDQALNNQFVSGRAQAKIIGSMCWQHGLDPPTQIKESILRTRR